MRAPSPRADVNHPLEATLLNEETMSKKTAFIFLAVIVVLCVAMPAYAQGGDAAAASSTAFYWAIPLGAGAAIGIAAGLCGLGQGKATASAVEALARNP